MYMNFMKQHNGQNQIKEYNINIMKLVETYDVISNLIIFWKFVN